MGATAITGAAVTVGTVDSVFVEVWAEVARSGIRVSIIDRGTPEVTGVWAGLFECVVPKYKITAPSAPDASPPIAATV